MLGSIFSLSIATVMLSTNTITLSLSIKDVASNSIFFIMHGKDNFMYFIYWSCYYLHVL